MITIEQVEEIVKRYADIAVTRILLSLSIAILMGVLAYVIIYAINRKMNERTTVKFSYDKDILYDGTMQTEDTITDDNTILTTTHNDKDGIAFIDVKTGKITKIVK